MNPADSGSVPDLLQRLGDRAAVPSLPLVSIERNVRRRRRRTRAIGVAAAVVLTGATALGAQQILGPAGTVVSDDTPVDPAATVDLEGAWNVVAIRTDEGILASSDGDDESGRVSLTFMGATDVQGTSECNSFEAELERGPQPGDIQIIELSGSDVGCNEVSSRRLAEVRQAFSTGDSTAALANQAGDVVLELRRQTFPEGEWAVESRTEDDVGLTVRDGALSGNSACNPVNGTYDVDARQSVVRFYDLSIGEALCGGRPALLDELRRSERWSSAYGSVFLYDSGWNVVLRLDPPPD